MRWLQAVVIESPDVGTSPQTTHLVLTFTFAAGDVAALLVVDVV